MLDKIYSLVRLPTAYRIAKSGLPRSKHQFIGPTKRLGRPPKITPIQAETIEWIGDHGTREQATQGLKSIAAQARVQGVCYDTIKNHIKKSMCKHKSALTLWLSERTKDERVKWCIERLSLPQSYWRRIRFSDETHCGPGPGHAEFVLRDAGTASRARPRNLQPRKALSKHQKKKEAVHIWAWIWAWIG